MSLLFDSFHGSAKISLGVGSGLDGMPLLLGREACEEGEALKTLIQKGDCCGVFRRGRQ